MTPVFANETDLVAKARAGSADAFNRLVNDNQQAVRAFLRRVCSDPAEADDLAQEAFLTAWSTLDRLRDGVKPRTWLCGIAWRKAQTAMRGRARSARRDRQLLDTRQIDFSEASEDRAMIDKAMAELPEAERAAVALCLAGDWSHTEAAEALGIPVGTVKSHVTRGRAKLLALLGAPK
jgi:RNA polymerase sigma-70 factor (ECF subfamily)